MTLQRYAWMAAFFGGAVLAGCESHKTYVHEERTAPSHEVYGTDSPHVEKEQIRVRGEPDDPKDHDKDTVITRERVVD